MFPRTARIISLPGSCFFLFGFLVQHTVLKRATCFATFLQSELNSDFARFITRELNLSCSKSGCCTCEKLLQKTESSCTFCNKISTFCAFYRPKANFCYNKLNVTLVYGLTSCNFIHQKQYSLYATCNNLICCKTDLNLDGKTRNIAFQLVLQQRRKTSCTFLLSVLPQLQLSMDCDLLLASFCLFVSFKRNILKCFSSFVRYLLILIFLNFQLFVFFDRLKFLLKGFRIF